MARFYWAAPLTPLAITDGPTVTAAALTDASPIPQRQVPVAAFEPGTLLKLHAQGEYSTASATPTLTLGFYFGTPGSIGTATVIAIGPAMPIVTGGAATGWPWEMDWEGEVRAPGAAGSIEGQGSIKFAALTSGLTAAQSVFPIPITQAGRLVTVNLAVQQYLMVGATWSSVTGAPSLICHHVSGESI